MLVKSVRVSEKGQIAIPVEIRQNAGIKKGDDLLLFVDEGRILLEKPPEKFRENFKGLLHLSSSVAKRLWDNKEDEIWDKL